jgi:hypothetical protein
MASADVTRRALSLGARDSTTGWPSKTYTNSVITGSFDPATAREAALTSGVPLNKIPFYSRPFFTSCYIRRGDHILHDIIGEVDLVTVSPVSRLNEFVFYACQCSEILMPADHATTSGTWHTDSDALKTDPRNRIKSWVDAHISYGVCDYQTMFAGIDYPMEREFIDNGLEIVSAIDLGQSQPEYTFDYKPYKFNETTMITNTARDTATLTATNVLESFEQAIRDVATDYPLGSIRRIRSTNPIRVDIGGMWLWQNTITIDYERANDDYLPSYPTYTWTTGTFIFPNIRHIYNEFLSDDDWMSPVNFSGALMQALGSKPLELTIECDLGFEHSSLTWKRPQTTTSKTDLENHAVFFDNLHNEGISQDYHTISFSAQGPTFKVRILGVETDQEDQHILRLKLREYREDSASDETYKQRFGITL